MNTNIQRLINMNRVLSSVADINNMFYYFYGRPASIAEKNYFKTNI